MLHVLQITQHESPRTRQEELLSTGAWFTRGASRKLGGAVPSGLCRDAAPTDVCRDAAPTDVCRDAAPIDLCRDAAPIDLCRDAAPIDLCKVQHPLTGMQHPLTCVRCNTH